MYNKKLSKTVGNTAFEIYLESVYSKALKKVENGELKISIKSTRCSIIKDYIETFWISYEVDLIYYLLVMKTKESNFIKLLPKILFNTLIRTPLKIILNKNRFNRTINKQNKIKVRYLTLSVITTI